jgi:hypothetical protein
MCKISLSPKKLQSKADYEFLNRRRTLSSFLLIGFLQPEETWKPGSVNIDKQIKQLGMEVGHN